MGASDSRQDQAKGTPIVLPSSSLAVIESSVISTVAILGSILTAVLIPAFFNQAAICPNEFVNGIEFL